MNFDELRLTHEDLGWKETQRILLQHAVQAFGVPPEQVNLEPMRRYHTDLWREQLRLEASMHLKDYQQRLLGFINRRLEHAILKRDYVFYLVLYLAQKKPLRWQFYGSPQTAYYPTRRIVEDALKVYRHVLVARIIIDSAMDPAYAGFKPLVGDVLERTLLAANHGHLPMDRFKTAQGFLDIPNEAALALLLPWQSTGPYQGWFPQFADWREVARRVPTRYSQVEHGLGFNPLKVNALGRGTLDALQRVGVTWEVVEGVYWFALPDKRYWWRFEQMDGVYEVFQLRIQGRRFWYVWEPEAGYTGAAANQPGTTRLEVDGQWMNL